MLDAFIALIGQATRTRSPYTGNHSDRVPDIAVDLLDQAIASQTGPFADFDMSAEERETFRLAAWLHDCGKLLCSDQVLDKSTKLHVLSNRIHEIRTRFEVLSRDAEIAYWRALHAGEDETAARARLDATQQQLEAEFALVARSNTGGSPVHAADLARLREIGARTWTPRFDRRLGLSAAEQQMLDATGTALPARERLLADRPEHIVPWGDDAPAVEPGDAGNHRGFDMKRPPHAAHHGELHNLSVARGTLNPAERFQANLHAVHTLTLLSALPLPPSLARLPEIAANHHEHLDGSGYPRRLRGDALSIPERVLAIADIFEALTAADRPYKTPRSVEDTLGAMQAMVQIGHLDRDLFALFLRSGVYQRHVYDGEDGPALDISRFMA